MGDLGQRAADGSVPVALRMLLDRTRNWMRSSDRLVRLL